MYALCVTLHLATEKAARERMLRVTYRVEDAPVLYCHQHRTGIWTIMGADGPDDTVFYDMLHVVSPPSAWHTLTYTAPGGRPGPTGSHPYRADTPHAGHGVCR